jgi:hypothetical protein
LNNAAVHINTSECGDPGPPNNVYGWGRVDVFAAVNKRDTYADTYTYTSASDKGQCFRKSD